MAILAQKEPHLLELSRHVAPNPVWAAMVVLPEDCYPSVIKDSFAPVRPDTDWLPTHLAGSVNRRGTLTRNLYCKDAVCLRHFWRLKTVIRVFYGTGLCF